MGRQTRSGFGYGMNESEARRDFREELNREYGEGSYRGGGNDIREWVESKCLQQPVSASAPKKTKAVKVSPKADGKLVNGFIVTTETPELIRRQAVASYTNESVPAVVEAYALTQGDAKKKADEIARRHNAEVHVLPARLWQDTTQRLSKPARILEVTPSGGQEAQPGKWRFTVEVAI
ncbi:hypothetical protein ABEV74_14600 [Paenibacillus cisolokensis]|uniref:hypothetical protein n=1 Tax=Paenibacillus cisolokensis TaxID=1658519 RepID=UPI003D2932B1